MPYAWKCKLFSFHSFITVFTSVTLEMLASSPPKQLHQKCNSFRNTNLSAAEPPDFQLILEKRRQGWENNRKRVSKEIQSMWITKTFYSEGVPPLTRRNNTHTPKKKFPKTPQKNPKKTHRQPWQPGKSCSNLLVHMGAVLTHFTAPTPNSRDPDTSSLRI